MERKKIRALSLSLASVTVIAGLAAYFTSSDTVTNSFSANDLQIRVIEPNWKDDPTIVPEQKVDKDPMIVNTGKTPAYVFMKVTVPAQKVTIEKASGDDEKGEYLANTAVPLFRFIDSDGNYTEDPLSSAQVYNSDWHLMETAENKGSSRTVESYTYLYAWTDKAEPSDEMAVLDPGETTDTPLFNEVILCNAREDSSLPGSTQKISIEVFGIQTEHLKASGVTETQADKVWQHLSEQKS
ncbi:MAG: hypothetical protein IJM55_06450 [Ruminococcus sp.]|nr:hypothetical protein [Ruminococcus sp.]